MRVGDRGLKLVAIVRSNCLSLILATALGKYFCFGEYLAFVLNTLNQKLVVITCAFVTVVPVAC